MKKRKVISYETVYREYEQEVEAETEKEAIRKANDWDWWEWEEMWWQQDECKAFPI